MRFIYIFSEDQDKALEVGNTEYIILSQQITERQAGKLTEEIVLIYITKY